MRSVAAACELAAAFLRAREEASEVIEGWVGEGWFELAGWLVSVWVICGVGIGGLRASLFGGDGGSALLSQELKTRAEV